MTDNCRVRAVAVVAMSAALVVGAACSPDAGSTAGRRSGATTGPVGAPADVQAGPVGAAADVQAADVVVVGEHPRGGSARVGLWSEPDPSAATVGGSAVRALVLPQLFVARPDGRWSAGLVKPGTDRLAADRLSATFAFRDGAAWSDGTPLTADDLRRTADARFVAGIEGPTADGIITVVFTADLPGWRRLWSGADAIAAPAAGVWGGPFVVTERTPGLETVLRRNDRWWGARPAFLDEVRLIVVPDPTTARQLLGRGDLDAVMPPAATVRTAQLGALPGVTVERVSRGGWSVALVTNGDRLDVDDRRSLFASLDRSRFVSTLLAGEAMVAHGFAGPEDATWRDVGLGELGSLRGDTVDLVGTSEEPMTGLVHRSMQRRVRDAGGTLELRYAEADRVEGWLRDGTYDAGVVMWLDPLGGCWRCRWESVDESLATAADAGDTAAAGALEARLRDDSLVLPLWRPDTVVAWRDGLVGPKANGYAASAAWNAWEWWRGP